MTWWRRRLVRTGRSRARPLSGLGGRLNSPVCLHFLYQYFFLYLKRKLRKREENEFAFAREDQTRQRRGDPKKKRASLSPTSVLFPHQATQRPLGGIIITERAFCSGSFFSISFFFFFGRGGGARAPDDARLLATLAQRRRSNEPPVAWTPRTASRAIA